MQQSIHYGRNTTYNYRFRTYHRFRFYYCDPFHFVPGAIINLVYNVNVWCCSLQLCMDTRRTYRISGYSYAYLNDYLYRYVHGCMWRRNYFYKEDHSKPGLAHHGYHNSMCRKLGQPQRRCYRGHVDQRQHNYCHYQQFDRFMDRRNKRFNDDHIHQ